ncbi:DUF2381 family protein [Hyalangium sp.]|uniref:DUF2381 family protein n=1 Tax=Hyalangium sp. TaxID=2028555 RepID=UPI002D3BFD01|nr:DUF2381 family protein [Hyalangium sp.]HYH96091.1 DUF2381 family protein [Hyalangium sp.]
MSLPGTALLVCTVLLWATASTAQPRPPREKKERQASLLRAPADPVSHVRLAAGVLTSLSFNAALARVQVEGRERFTRLDVGERAIYLEPALELAPTERLALHVTFADGREAVLLLVPHPTEVDTRVDFTLPERSAETCELDLAATRARCEAQSQELERQFQETCATHGPALLALAGDMNGEFSKTSFAWASTAMLHAHAGVKYRLGRWVVLTVQVENRGTALWTPARARLTFGTHPPIPVQVVFPSRTGLAPGATARIALELKLPVPGAPHVLGAKHDLTLCDSTEERCLSALEINLD